MICCDKSGFWLLVGWFITKHNYMSLYWTGNGLKKKGKQNEQVWTLINNGYKCPI